MKTALVIDSLSITDLIAIDLLAPFFSIARDVLICDFISFNLELEERDQLRPFIDSGVLIEKTLSAKRIQEMIAIRNGSDGYHLSDSDSACLYLAKLHGATLMTDAKPLQEAGKQHKIPISGLLWVLDTLVSSKVLPPAVTLEKLRQLQSSNSSISSAECERRLRQWENQRVLKVRGSPTKGQKKK